MTTHLESIQYALPNELTGATDPTGASYVEFHPVQVVKRFSDTPQGVRAAQAECDALVRDTGGSMYLGVASYATATASSDGAHTRAVVAHYAPIGKVLRCYRAVPMVYNSVVGRAPYLDGTEPATRAFDTQYSMVVVMYTAIIPCSDEESHTGGGHRLARLEGCEACDKERTRA